MIRDDDDDARSVRAALSRHVGRPLPADLVGIADAYGLTVGGWVFPSVATPVAGVDDGVIADVIGKGRVVREHAVAAGVTMLLPGDAGWPTGTGCDDLPCLWVFGDPDVAGLLRRAVTLTGSRAATAYGLHMAADLAYGMSTVGWTLAAAVGLGIDSEVARTALAVHGRVLLVAGNGLSTPYPSALGGLLEQVTSRGAVLSPFPVGIPPSPARLAVRQHLLGTLTSATVVVEASPRSRALITARAAATTGRTVYAVPGPVTSATSVGCHQLLTAGARLAVRAADVVSAPGSSSDTGVEPQPFRVTATASWDEGSWRTRTVPPFTVTATSHRDAADAAFRIVFAANPHASGATLTAGVVDRVGVYEAVQVSSSA